MDTPKSFKHRATLVGVVAILVLALVPAALAAKGGGGKTTTGTGGLELYVLTSNSQWAGSSAPSFGSTVKFQVPATVTSPNVELVCSQNGTVVFASLSGWYETSTWTRNMTLSSQMWTGGAASCTATLYTISGLHTVTLGTLSFDASA